MRTDDWYLYSQGALLRGVYSLQRCVTILSLASACLMSIACNDAAAYYRR